MKTIPLTQGYEAIVDDEDYARVVASPFRWQATVVRKKHHVLVYARRSIYRPETKRQYTENMHNFIMGIKGVDHKDSNGLNNQRQNLRPANKSQNKTNVGKFKRGASSRWKGVSWEKRLSRWRAGIKKDGRSINLGTFRNEYDAATAYNFAAYELHGEFARFNDPADRLLV